MQPIIALPFGKTQFRLMRSLGGATLRPRQPSVTLSGGTEVEQPRRRVLSKVGFGFSLVPCVVLLLNMTCRFG